MLRLSVKRLFFGCIARVHKEQQRMIAVERLGYTSLGLIDSLKKLLKILCRLTFSSQHGCIMIDACVPRVQRAQKANVVLELPQLFQPIEHLIIRHVRHHFTCFTCFTSSLEKRELKKKWEETRTG